MKQLLAAWLLLVCAACGGNSPTGPSTTPPVVPVPPVPSTVTLTGRVTQTNGGQPLAGLALSLGGQASTTDGAGGFTYQLAPGGSQRLLLTGSGIVPRSLLVAIGSRDVAVDAIGVAGFDLNFYRQVVRNTFDAPAGMEPLRRLTAAPMIYLKTVDEAGALIDARTLETTQRAIVETAALFTGGRFGVAGLERGTDTRVGVAGWITVRWPAVNAADRRCGEADIARSGGVIDFYYKQEGCRCSGGPAIRERTVRHELGHAFGFFHTDATTDLMSGLPAPGCDLLPSAREQAAAAIAYARPVGNMDPDIDPVGAVTLAPLTVR